MDAMILAAGLGTRLRPLTLRTPKALVEVDGVPMLERVARRLIAAGADRILVNVSYLAAPVQAYVDGADWRTADGAPVEVLRGRGARDDVAGDVAVRIGGGRGDHQQGDGQPVTAAPARAGRRCRMRHPSGSGEGG